MMGNMWGEGFLVCSHHNNISDGQNCAQTWPEPARISLDRSMSLQSYLGANSRQRSEMWIGSGGQTTKPTSEYVVG